MMELTPWKEVQDAMPILSSSEYEQLKASIEQDGVKNPLLVLPDGRIIDGYHRWFACNELGLEPPYRIEDTNEQDAFRLAIILNLARRQLSFEQLKPIHEYLRQHREERKQIALELRGQGKTQEEAATAVGVTQTTILCWERSPVEHDRLRDNLAKKVGGKTEVQTPAGTADVVTATHVYEVDDVKRWKQALGQVLSYATALSLSPVLYLYGRMSDKFKEVVLSTARSQSVELQLYEGEYSCKPPDQRVKVPPSEHQAILDLRAEGLTLIEIASRYDVTHQAIRKIIAKTQADTPSSKFPDVRVKIDKTEHQAIYDRWQAGETQESIAADYKVTRRAITSICAKVQRRIDKELAEAQAAAEAAALPSATTICLYQDDALLRVPTLQDRSIALVITDPPYNTTDHEWDQMGTPQEYLDWTRAWMEAVRPKLQEQYHLYLFCAPEYQADIEMLLRAEGWPIKSRIIWEYRNLVKGRDAADKYLVNYQVVFHCGMHALNFPLKWDDTRFSVQTVATPQSNFAEGKYHPTQKPVELIERFVRFGSKPGDTVLDLFAGSGTTGLACQNVGARRCILIEQSSEYCNAIEARLGVGRQTWQMQG